MSTKQSTLTERQESEEFRVFEPVDV